MRRSKRYFKKLVNPDNQQNEGEGESDNEIEYENYYDFFYNYLFPLAIEYGMSPTEFWEEDPQLFASYRISFFNKKKRELEEVDYKCWLEGKYNHESRGLIFSLFQKMINAVLNRSSISEIEDYPKVPYSQEERMNKQKEIKEKNRYEQYQKEIVRVGTLKQQYLNRLKREEDKK